MRLLLLILALTTLLAPAKAQGSPAFAGPMMTTQSGGAANQLAGPPSPFGISEASFGPELIQGPSAASAFGSDEEPGMSSAIEIALILTVLSVLPALLITVTCFTRIVIVLSFVRRAMSINELPPNPVLIGLALFLTAFVMGPIVGKIYNESWLPYQANELTMGEASDSAWDTLSGFLLANTRQSEIELFEGIAGGTAWAAEAAAESSGMTAAEAGSGEAGPPPMRVVIPAFILSELKTAFQMGFLLFLPFLVIDLVISSVLLSMGMFMLPPVMISTPFKILLFVLVDGWHLVVSSLVTSFVA
ncbi:MAG: flagellar type III secretion system pore protein FliP [Planctomycetota bacterium]|nr:flagellar type III secretion system pore protein FliP [Planctomycetota bacterium]